MPTSTCTTPVSTFSSYRLHHQPLYSEDRSRSRQSRPMRNFFTNVKDKLSGNSAESAPKTASSPSPLPSSNPFSPTSVPMAAPASPRNTTSGTTPTRRPPATEAPPAYTEAPTVQTGPTFNGTLPPRACSPTPSVISATSLSNAEDPYAFLTTFDTIFVIDDSGSMAGRSWREVEEALRTIAPICTARDPDGIDVFFLNHKSSSPAVHTKGSAAGGYRGLADANAVARLFSAVRPSGGTPTGTRLHNILKPYLQLCAEKRENLDAVRPVNIIVITDGVPSDDVESVLVSAAKKLDNLDAPPYQVGVQFFQVGNEPGAAAALSELDDGLSELVDGGIRDMVDTVSWSSTQGSTRTLSADGILKAVLGAVVKRLDRRPATGERRGSRQHLSP